MEHILHKKNFPTEISGFVVVVIVVVVVCKWSVPEHINKELGEYPNLQARRNKI